jgi:hypothetical protein
MRPTVIGSATALGSIGSFLAMAAVACGQVADVEQPSIDPPPEAGARRDAGPAAPPALDGGPEAPRRDAAEAGIALLPYCQRVFFEPLVLDRCCTTAQERAHEASRYKAAAENARECSKLFTDSVARGRMVFHPSALAGCFAVLDPSQVVCSERRSRRSAWRAVPNECRTVYSGAVGAGGACRWNDECGGGMVCHGGDADRGIDGTCGAPALAGQPCEPSFDTFGRIFSFRGDVEECADGLRCVGSSGAGVCEPATKPRDTVCTSSDECAVGLTCSAQKCAGPASLPIGSACSGDAVCAAGSFCTIPSPPPASDPSVCRARGTAGAPCFFDDDCAGRCDAATKTCVAHCGG